MNNDAMPLGYRIVGPCDRERRLVDYDRAFAAYAACDSLAHTDQQGFLSPFQYDDAIRERIVKSDLTLNVRDYNGRCWSRFVWFDIDDDGNIDGAAASARVLCSLILDRYRLDETELLIFFSGSKGFHVGLPLSLFAPEPSTEFHRITRRLAEGLAAKAGVKIDTSVYSIVQPLRAPNSRHGKTGRYKRFFTLDELLKLRPSAMVDRAAEPLPFELPEDPSLDDQAVLDWNAATERVKKQAEALKERGTDRTDLMRVVFDVIEGDIESPRRTAVYSAAANLAELGVPAVAVHALLTPGALDSGLPPSDVRRAIDNGLSKGARTE
ncbi:DNA primase [Novipirellula artificiosorum]|uniref:DNA primase small subunit n=1 Tax=Novipirellula artificiosorum TaxID=2528016 RepID=A0A5C6DDH3_9BACT|nr:DNA primase [Novipirellula artificiosorum]TWU33741.1 hypothetical protein Poly41_47370 [Novipirellula artificiosorum]